MDTVNVDWQNISPFIIEGNKRVQEYELHRLIHRNEYSCNKKHDLCCYCVFKTIGKVNRVDSNHVLSVEVNICTLGGFTIQTNGTCIKFKIKDKYVIK